MKLLIRSIACCCLFTLVWVQAASVTLAADTLAADRPNILFIFSDDHAPHAIGAYKGWLKSVNPTPAIDRLAAQGMLFENSFCTNSICGPSRAVIMTGKHSHLNGFMNNGNSFDWNQQTFPKLLRQAGYETALYGKSHLKGTPQGFDHWAVLPGQGMYYNPNFITPEGRVRKDGYCTDLVTDMADEFLRNGRDAKKPFMLMVQHKAPHRNWLPAVRHLKLYDDIRLPEPSTLFDRWEDNAEVVRHHELGIDKHMQPNYDLMVQLDPGAFDRKTVQGLDKNALYTLRRMSAPQLKAWQDAFGEENRAFHAAKLTGKELVRWKYQRYAKNYLRCVRGVDESVERLMATLDELGIADNTIVIYSSDQGFYIGDHGWFDKRWMYEESLKMPLIIKWPGVVKPGSRNTNLVQNLDYAQTFLDIAGVEAPEEAPAGMQGKSLVGLLRGEDDPTWRDSIYYHYYEYPSVHMVPRHCGVRTDRYKLMYFYRFGQWEFYDLETDPDELKNLYGQPEHAEQIEIMKRRLIALQKHYGDDTVTKEMPKKWQQEVRIRN